MLAVHADWSVDPRKRWMAVAEPRPGGWTLTPPQPVGDLPTLFDRLVARDRTIALGVDLPLGLPRAYAQQHAQEANFPAFLRALEHRPEFFQVCDHLDQLAPNRPFYPARGRKGMTRAAHAAALGLGDPSGLSRACDRARPAKPRSAPGATCCSPLSLAPPRPASGRLTATCTPCSPKAASCSPKPIPPRPCANSG